MTLAGDTYASLYAPTITAASGLLGLRTVTQVSSAAQLQAQTSCPSEFHDPGANRYLKQNPSRSLLFSTQAIANGWSAAAAGNVQLATGGQRAG